MSTRSARRNSTRRSRTRRPEITPDQVKEKLEKFEQKKNKFAEKFNLVTQYEEVGNGQEMLNAFKRSQLHKKIDKFVKEYVKQEENKLDKVEKDLRQEIKKNILENNFYSVSDKREKLNNLIGEYEEIIGQIRTAMEAKKSRDFEKYTFEYYYHKSYENNLSSNEVNKIKNDIADLQLLVEEEENIEKKEELGHQIYDKYELLNKVIVDSAFVDLLKNGFEDPILIKEEIYYGLNDYVNESITSLYSSRSPTSMVGKKKTKKRKNLRKIMKSKKKNKIQKGSGSSEHKCFDTESIKNYNKKYDSIENSGGEICSDDLSMQLQIYVSNLDSQKKINPPTIQLIPYCGENEKGISKKDIGIMDRFISDANLNEISNETIKTLTNSGLLKIDTSRIENEETNNQTVFKSESNPTKFFDFMKDKINTNMLIVTHSNFLIQLYNLLHKKIYGDENVINLDTEYVNNMDSSNERYIKIGEEIKCKKYKTNVNFANLDILAIYFKNNDINGINIFRFNENYKGINNLKDDENVIFLMRHCYACHNFIMNKVRETKQTEPDGNFKGLMSNCLIGTIQTMKNNSNALSAVLNNNKFEYGSSVLLRSITTCMLQYYISQNK